MTEVAQLSAVASVALAVAGEIGYIPEVAGRLLPTITLLASAWCVAEAKAIELQFGQVAHAVAGG